MLLLDWIHPMAFLLPKNILQCAYNVPASYQCPLKAYSLLPNCPLKPYNVSACYQIFTSERPPECLSPTVPLTSPRLSTVSPEKKVP